MRCAGEDWRARVGALGRFSTSFWRRAWSFEGAVLVALYWDGEWDGGYDGGKRC